MKRHCTTIAGLLLAATLPAEAALRLSPDGTGDAIYVPYYTVEDGQSTLVAVSNHSDQPTAARILFSEALNGQAVLYFTVFLPPHGQWTAAVTAGDNGGAVMYASADVCHLPSTIGGNAAGTPFLPFDYADNYPDGGPTGLDRTRTGAIEVLEFASLGGAMGNEASARNCRALDDRYLGRGTPRLPDLRPSTGRISASAQVVNVAEGTIYPVSGIAISGFFGRPTDVEMEPLPRISSPVLAQGAGDFEVQLPLGRFAVDRNRGADAISALFMTRALYGDISVNPLLGSSTAWIVSFPTRHAYVADLPGSLASNGMANAPFTAAFGPGGACEPLPARRTARNGHAAAPMVASTVPAAPAGQLCGQVNVRRFASNQPFEGTERLDLTGNGRTLRLRNLDVIAYQEIEGLPAVGLRTTEVINQNVVAGVRASYTVALPLSRDSD